MMTMYFVPTSIMKPLPKKRSINMPLSIEANFYMFYSLTCLLSSIQRWYT